MRAVLLGTAAGGGFPQWNCACARCVSGAPPRAQDCLAVSADGQAWYLVNAAPDLRAQILATPELAAGPGPRDTPIRGALLTDAELDHTLGLLLLRGAAGLRVWAPKAVLHAVRDEFPLREIVDAYGAWDWLPVESEVDIGDLRVSVLPVSDKHPKYAATSTVDGPWVVAYRIEDPATGGVLVYAPCLADWPPGFDEFASGASYALIDGTFYAAAEMSGATRSGVADGVQHAMGHLPIAGDHGSLARIRRALPGHRGVRWAYTHLNNTNPLVDPATPEHAEVLTFNIDLPPDGTRLDL
ncbi:pyrroloquinoline quinone biosynthesis protein PqqB [Amycolatopsis anabasis]|uniref:pyrroloquinoline quinone biosynthesis protein PqqB n=1 Tax=Amycolatopsis anabasis TaxID=1840409 RepID=UPI00131B400D|nr:pyrroloquinoline quinone biosynthesis protein PqqB [Amycolatopsis anabasis]